ncbi:MAG: glycosyltransferase family 2 protein [Chloroflexota bacterium]
MAINIVTYNSASVIDACLTSVTAQDYANFSVTVIDNDSRDNTRDVLEPWRNRGIHVLTNDANLYYSRAHNYGIHETDSEFVLTLNPDVIIRPDFLARVVNAFDRHPRIGSINGKLLLLDSTRTDFSTLAALPVDTMLIDSAGLMMFRSRRPFLRGNRKPAGSTCMEPAHIFGADGACAAYRRTMLDDVAVEAEYFDNDFVIYREDVDLAWRARLYGWDAYYLPEAVGYHVRGFHPGQSRRSIPNHLKRQSVKNGWLLVIKNDTPRSVLRDSLYIAPYQLKVLAGLVSIERSSLGAMLDLLKLIPRMRQKRAEIQAKRRRSNDEMQPWFE